MSELRGMRAFQGRSYIDIEAVATYVRAQLKLGPTNRLDAFELFEGLPKCRIKLADRLIRVQCEVDDLPDGVEGSTTYFKPRDEVHVCLSPATYDALEQRRPRAVFAAVHEVGHAFLHVHELIQLAQIPHPAAGLQRGARTHAAFRDTEWQANAFGAALLVPAAGAAAVARNVGHLSADALQGAFGVSAQAAGYRVDVLLKHFPNLFVEN